MSDIRSEPLTCRMCGCFMIDVLEGEEAPCKDGRHRYIGASKVRRVRDGYIVVLPRAKLLEEE